MQDAQAMLQQRPAMEEITGRYEEMQGKLRDRLVAELGLAVQWEPGTDPLNANCEDLDLSHIQRAEQRNLQGWRLRTNIPDAQWPRAQQLAIEVTADYGFGNLEVILDRPRNHKIQLNGPFGAQIQFGTQVHTVMWVRTGCHLLQSAKG